MRARVRRLAAAVQRETRPNDLKKESTKMDDQEIPERQREQLGVGVRGKYHNKFAQDSNVVVLRPDIYKAFPTSQAVNDALASYLAFANEAVGLTRRSSGRPTKQRAA